MKATAPLSQGTLVYVKLWPELVYWAAYCIINIAQCSWCRHYWQTPDIFCKGFHFPSWCIDGWRHYSSFHPFHMLSTAGMFVWSEHHWLSCCSVILRWETPNQSFLTPKWHHHIIGLTQQSKTKLLKQTEHKWHKWNEHDLDSIFFFFLHLQSLGSNYTNSC